MPSTRRLAAILAADVAGYSRLMGADEEGTHERLKAHLRQLIEPKIEEHRGHVVELLNRHAHGRGNSVSLEEEQERIPALIQVALQGLRRGVFRRPLLRHLRAHLPGPVKLSSPHSPVA